MNYDPPWRRKFRIAGVLLAILFHVSVIFAVTTFPGLHKGGFGFLFCWYMPAIFLGLPWSFGAMFLPSELASLLGIAGSVCLNGYLIGWVIDTLVNNAPVRSRKRKLSTKQVQRALASDPTTLRPEQIELLTQFIEDAGGIENARTAVNAPP